MPHPLDTHRARLLTLALVALALLPAMAGAQVPWDRTARMTSDSFVNVVLPAFGFATIGWYGFKLMNNRAFEMDELAKVLIGAAICFGPLLFTSMF